MTGIVIERIATNSIDRLLSPAASPATCVVPALTGADIRRRWRNGISPGSSAAGALAMIRTTWRGRVPAPADAGE